MKKPRISCCGSDSESPQVDRISALPDDTLIHILSFLTTKQAVHTCVLAKRWTNLWASVPVLVLVLDEFQTDGQVGDPETSEEARKLFRRFDTFVHGVLGNRKPTNLNSVIYSCPFEGWDCGSRRPMAPHNRVSLLNRPEINMFFNYYNPLFFLNSIFSCASLECLEIYLNASDRTTIFPLSISLPSLKYLKLSGVKLYGCFAEELLMCCPSLEFLKLTDSKLYCSSISSKVLKNLVIRRCYHHEEMQISCPGLVTLSIHSYLRRGISLKSMTSVEDAFIAFRRWHEKVADEELPVCNLLGGLATATNLVFYVSPLLKLKRDIPNCKHFNNLKNLTILGMSHDFDLVGCFLKHSPKLEVLKLHLHEKNQGDFHGEPRLEVLGDLSFQHEYLKSVHIYGFDRCKLLASELLKILSVYVKKIGRMVLR